MPMFSGNTSLIETCTTTASSWHWWLCRMWRPLPHRQLALRRRHPQRLRPRLVAARLRQASQAARQGSLCPAAPAASQLAPSRRGAHQAEVAALYIGDLALLGQAAGARSARAAASAECQGSGRAEQLCKDAQARGSLAAHGRGPACTAARSHLPGGRDCKPVRLAHVNVPGADGLRGRDKRQLGERQGTGSARPVRPRTRGAHWRLALCRDELDKVLDARGRQVAPGLRQRALARGQRARGLRGRAQR